ncbi:MAG: tRNA pseudouridine synthase B [Sulfuricurvum sp. PC08-66]|nr:MAG: tRNA pseudouridine synthase B [Sulfuricurvum sp. PC08-66]
MDALFVGYKPSYISSNAFLGRLKRKYRVKKAGYSGTLDPFAKGVLIVALGRHTRLFSHLAKTPKTYRATLWLGVQSDTLDIEGDVTHYSIAPYDLEKIRQTVEGFTGEFTYTPPIYSAKRIDGERAYDLARQGKEVKLSNVTSTLHEVKFLHYCHPFITFEATVSEGTYIRSLGAHIAQALGTTGILSSLERLREGRFVYEAERFLAPMEYIDAQPNTYLGDIRDIVLGKKLQNSDFTNPADGKYLISLEDNFAIILIHNSTVEYLLNKVPLC